MNYRTIFIYLSLSILLLAAKGCSTATLFKNSNINLNVDTSSTINPDANGRASPVIMLVFQLSSPREFTHQDFFDLYDNADKSMPKTLLSTHELELIPSASASKSIKLTHKTKSLGIVVAFRNLEFADWKHQINLDELDSNGISIVIDDLTAKVSSVSGTL